MVRFIFFCMAVLALSLIAIPVTTMLDGIADQRTETLAEAPPAETTADPDYFAADTTAAPSVDQLNAIETAAGGAEGSLEETSNMPAGFSGTAPGALDDTQPDPAVQPVTPQDN